MSITLTYAPTGGTHTTVDLGERLLWTDEYEWSAVIQETAYSTTGALLVDVATRQAGRPISLDGQSGAAWMPRSVIAQLNSLKALPGAVFTLTVRGVARSVLWLEFTAHPIWKLADGEHTETLEYVPNFKFIEIEI